MKKYIVAGCIIVLIIAGCFLLYSINNKDNNNEDALKFKEEYEKLNGEVAFENNNYPEVSIKENNTVKYITDEEAVDLIQNYKGIIYFGFANCPWCRSMIESLTNVAIDNNTTIYYLDILDIRSKMELIKDGKKYQVEEKNKGTDSYYKLLDLLDNELSDYVLTDENNKEYKTGEKRLYAPTVIAFNKGVIKDFHEGTIDSQENGFSKLTEKQKKELNTIFTKLIKSIK